MTALTFEALARRLAVPSDTLILMHRNPDGDAVGTAFALRELLGALGSRAWCVCEGELPARLRFLAAPVQESVLLQSVPFDADTARVIAVDVASPAQLGGLRERFEGHTDCMIDHHATGTPFADHYVDGHAAATAEILFDLFRHFEAHVSRPARQICSMLPSAATPAVSAIPTSRPTPTGARRNWSRAASTARRSTTGCSIPNQWRSCAPRQWALANCASFTAAKWRSLRSALPSGRQPVLPKATWKR